MTERREAHGLALPGSLDPLSLRRLSRVLHEHTTAADRCHSSVWEGHGTSPSSWQAQPRFQLLGRSHWLFPPVAVLGVPESSVELAVAGRAQPWSTTRSSSAGRSSRRCR